MVTVTQLHSSDVPSAELNRILNQHLAVEHLRIFRRLLVKRFGLLSVIVLVVGLAFHWISLVATAGTIVALVIPPAWVWVVEVRRDRALARRLERIPGIIHSHPRSDKRPAVEPRQKVVKSS
jgi:hypothetical protein